MMGSVLIISTAQMGIEASRSPWGHAVESIASSLTSSGIHFDFRRSI